LVPCFRHLRERDLAGKAPRDARRRYSSRQIYTAFRLSDPRVTDFLGRAKEIALNPVAMAELPAGFRGGDREACCRRALEEYLESPRVILLSVDRDTAEYETGARTASRRRAT
jgi:hypothetical protein